MSRIQDTAPMHRSDEELDRDWKPNGRRPQSTVARSFSAELMDIFRIDNSLADLDNQVEKKKQEVTSQTSELEALERRIREMEERLNRNKAPSAPSAVAGSQRLPVQQGGPASVQRTSRPGTAKAQQQAPLHGGAMPPTPTASEDGDHDS
ncbi:hypothetical protein KJ359_012112 [Pestalotiopsis sp. 9143b]|nr:hypothetical protein KJ359_012112 [Pestalotiopsis sp. 9143b]